MNYCCCFNNNLKDKITFSLAPRRRTQLVSHPHLLGDDVLNDNERPSIVSSKLGKYYI